MNNDKINISVLVAPLDWGLGHATRCIPIINLLLQKGCRVIIAATGAHTILLKQVFPKVQFLHLEGYNIEYAKKNILYKLAKQLPKISAIIKKEQIWLEKIIDEHQISLVISDNRYGLWSKRIPSIFITHQLQLQLPTHFNWAKNLLRNKLYTFIEKFSVCWIPDVANEEKSLSGILGHPTKMPSITTVYVGPLSRFSNRTSPKKKHKLMVCLSGPEPQRSLLEANILPQLKEINGPVLLVRGKPGSKNVLSTPNNVIVQNHLPTNEMQQAFEESEYIISRCGYTTLMDMQILQCKCIYIPTPGQTEQEYLGKRLADLNIAIVCKQQDFDLNNALERAADFHFKQIPLQKSNSLEMAVDEALKLVKLK